MQSCKVAKANMRRCEGDRANVRICVAKREDAKAQGLVVGYYYRSFSFATLHYPLCIFAFALNVFLWELLINRQQHLFLPSHLATFIFASSRFALATSHFRSFALAPLHFRLRNFSLSHICLKGVRIYSHVNIDI